MLVTGVTCSLASGHLYKLRVCLPDVSSNQSHEIDHSKSSPVSCFPPSNVPLQRTLTSDSTPWQPTVPTRNHQFIIIIIIQFTTISSSNWNRPSALSQTRILTQHWTHYTGFSQHSTKHLRYTSSHNSHRPRLLVFFSVVDNSESVLWFVPIQETWKYKKCKNATSLDKLHQVTSLAVMVLWSSLSNPPPSPSWFTVL